MKPCFQKYLVITGLLCAQAFDGYSQQNFITNPGFEGPDGIEVIPEDWFAGCGVINTPDTQPGWWNVELKPHEGKSYINLLYKDDGTTESVYQKLAQPLPAGSCFLVEIFLARMCQDSLSGLFPYDLNHPGDLLIRGSESYGCGTGQTLALFQQVDNCRWEKYQAVFQAQTDLNYIYLEFSRGASDFANGSVLIDDIHLDFLEPLPQENLSFDYLGDVTVQAALPGNNFNWTADGVPVDNDSSFYHLTLTQNTFVELEYWSDDSCRIFESFMIYVKPHIPNIITPNDHNNINDIFYIEGLIETAEVYVINRWGETVFSSPDYQNDWSPQNLVDGVYFYSVHVKESDRFFQGSLTIH